MVILSDKTWADAGQSHKWQFASRLLFFLLASFPTTVAAMEPRTLQNTHSCTQLAAKSGLSRHARPGMRLSIRT